MMNFQTIVIMHDYYTNNLCGIRAKKNITKKSVQQKKAIR